jgi:hypothetical protein
MQTFKILLMPIDRGYRALVGDTIVDSFVLNGFGRRIEESLRTNVGEEFDTEWVASRDLRHLLPECSMCNGSEHIPAANTCAAETLRIEGKLSFKEGTQECPVCRGTGLELRACWS